MDSGTGMESILDIDTIDFLSLSLYFLFPFSLILFEEEEKDFAESNERKESIPPNDQKVTL